jgi:SAM-dependent methyltransferase
VALAARQYGYRLAAVEKCFAAWAAVLAETGESADRVRFYCDYLFDEIPLQGKTMLDVGAGDGRYSFYAACAGARRVVGLEPEVEGSRTGMHERFERARSLLGLQTVDLEPRRLQDYDARGETFDVLLLHDSVNHLDEAACMRLGDDPTAGVIYRVLFEKLAHLSLPNGTLIVADCSNENLFARLGVKNPLAPTIEWRKHQKPELWAGMLAEVGFRSPRIRWTSFNRLGSVGRVLLSNRLAAYCLTSHFCLTMRRIGKPVGSLAPETAEALGVR